MTDAEFVHEVYRRMEKLPDYDVLYLHREGEGKARYAVVSVDWLNRHGKAESALFAALRSFPDTSKHEHLTADD